MCVLNLARAFNDKTFTTRPNFYDSDMFRKTLHYHNLYVIPGELKLSVWAVNTGKSCLCRCAYIRVTN